MFHFVSLTDYVFQRIGQGLERCLTGQSISWPPRGPEFVSQRQLTTTCDSRPENMLSLLAYAGTIN